jgi:hypothetical protein
MKKLRLALEEISVESFATLPQQARLGTVPGHQLSGTTCGQFICDCPTNGYEHTCNTCQASCNGTCPATCGGDTCYTCDNTCNVCQSVGGTCGDFTCDHTCEGQSCQYCTYEGQIICA